MTPVDGEMNASGETLNELINKDEKNEEEEAIAAKTAAAKSGKSSDGKLESL
jgi:hypothetical protein